MQIKQKLDYSRKHSYKKSKNTFDEKRLDINTAINQKLKIVARIGNCNDKIIKVK